MRLIKVADNYERYLDPGMVDEYRRIKAKYNSISDKFVNHVSRVDQRDIRWKNRMEEIKREMDEARKELDDIRSPAVEKMEKHREEMIKREEEEKRRTEEIYEKAKNDTSFQIKIENAVEDWPRTENPRLAGYIMQDGSMLNFSHQGYQRDMDHREITGEIDELSGGTDGMMQFQLATGAIRLHAQGNGYVSFDWETEPTRSQKRKVIEIAENNSEILVRAKDKEKEYDSAWEMAEDLRWY